MPKTLPKHEDVFVLRTREEADTLASALKFKGYLAFAEGTGRCHTDDNGEHYHPWGVMVKLTPAQAERLAR